MIGTAAISPIEPTSVADDLLGDELDVDRVEEAELPGAEDQQDGQRRADVGEDERVDGRGDVVAADVERAAVELAEAQLGIGRGAAPARSKPG